MRRPSSDSTQGSFSVYTRNSVWPRQLTFRKRGCDDEKTLRQLHSGARNEALRMGIRYKTDGDKFVVSANLKRRGWEEVTSVLDDDW